MRKPLINAVSAAVLSCGLTGGLASSQAASSFPYQNAALPVNARVDDLINRMTLEEKVAQLQTVWQQRRGMENQQQH